VCIVQRIVVQWQKRLLPPTNHAIRAARCSIKWSRNISKPFLPRSIPIPTPSACRPMCNENFTTTCSVASSPITFCAWDVTPVRKRYCWPSVASGAGFVRRVREGAWPRPRPTWSSASFPGSQRGNGWCQCPFPCATGWRLQNHHSRHDFSVLHQPSGRTRYRAAEGPTGVGDVYTAIRWSH